MADANTNPYLALLQQEDKPPSLAQILQHVANLGFGMAGGLGQAASTGGSTIGGLGTGLILGNQINAQAAQRAEQERQKRLEWQFRAQEHEDKRAEMIRKQNALAAFGQGFNVAPQQGPLMGPPPPTTGAPPTTTGAPPPGSYDTRVAGLEGGTKKGGMVFNELGSGAFGPYQFMPATWAAVRAQNPSLNLPEDITTATREQHDAAHGAFKAGNAQGLQAGGFQPTPENLYLAHRFGLGGALSVLRADENKPLAEVLPIDWQRQNPDMRGQTAGGFRRLATERVGGSPAATVPYVVRPDAKPTQYALMPDDVPFSLSSGETTLPRPSTAEPSFTAPVMPQPTWEKPGDVVPVNPAEWFPQPAPPPAPPAVPVPGGPPSSPGTPTPGGPNVVQAQYQPQPGGPTMAPGGGPAPGAVDAPPQRPVTPMPQPDPEVVARARFGIAEKIITPEQGLAMVRQNVMDKFKQVDAQVEAQHAATLEVYKQRQEGRRHERGVAEETARNERRLAEEAAREARRQEVEKEREERRAAAEEARFQRDLAEKEKVRAAAGDQAGTKRGDEQTKAQREDENKLRDDFDKAKPVQAYRVVVPMLESAKKAGPTRAGDLNLIYAFAKLMDPDSVVRESETGMVTATGTFGDRLAGMTSQLTGGAQLTPETRAKLITELDSRFGALEASYKAHEEAYRGIAERRGHNFDNIRIPIRPDKPAEPAPATPPSGTFPAPPQAAIKALQMAPDQREDFDKMFGPGAAAKVLGR